MLTAPLLFALLVQAPAEPSKIIPELRAAFAEAPVAETFRVYAALHERLTYDDLAAEVEVLPRGVRQQHVEDRLRSFADARQGGVLALLGALESEGAVHDVRQLWITNSVKFWGTAEAIQRIAALPEVDYIGWDPVRAVSEYEDAGPAAPALPPAGGFTTFYFQGFEGGVLPPGSLTATTGCGNVSVTNLYGPKTGGFHLVMASTTDSCDGTATFGLRVDLSAATTARLRFQLKDMSDEFTSGLDKLDVSNDGVVWTKLADLTGSDGAYLAKEYSLDGLGLVYDSDVFFRWSWSDNFTPETDGFGIDDIEIADGFAPPPPPSPEVNLTQLQAPALWAKGFDGSGAVLMNVDDGTDLHHPDLVDRIWNNPLDPVDGVDNDGNGYVDDIHGWDFFANDNNPEGGSHGTNTAGIMVGDGSAGVFQTGMAPGASLVVALIGGESDHWEALQYGISIGIDASSSSHSYKWYFSPQPDYSMHRSVSEMVLAAGIIHANSIGNDGGSGSAPKPFNISAPGLCPGPWRHPVQTQVNGKLGATLGCGGIELNDTHYSFSGSGPSAWENVTVYDASYPFPQNPAYFDYPVGGFGLPLQGLVKPDVVTYTNVMTTAFGGGYLPGFGGTSAATPHLGGAFCLLIDAQPKAKPRQISQALQRSAVDLGTPGKDQIFGAGKVQVLAAALRLFHLITVDTPTAKLGAPLHIGIDGQASEFYAALWSTKLGSTPVGTLGTLDLGTPFYLLKVGQLSGAGHDDVNITIPNQATLVGVDLYVQSVEDDLAGTYGQYLFSVVDTFRVIP
jgi:hypothetical protein